MKRYYAYVVKDMVSYFENEVAKRDVNIIKRESINNDELYYYVLEAEEGIIDPKFELREAQASFLYIFEMDLQRLSPMSYGRGSRATIDMQLGFRKRSP